MRLGLVNNKWFLSYFLSTFLTRSGENIYALAFPFLVLELGSSITTFAYVFIVEYLPYIVLTPIIGSILDKYDRRRLLVLSDIFRIILLLIIPISLSLNIFHISLVFIVAFLTTTVVMINRTLSEHSVLPYLVPKDKLNRANAFYIGSSTVARTLGLLFGGVLISIFGASKILIFNALMYIIPILVISFIPIRFAQYENKNTKYLLSLMEGFKYLKDNFQLKMFTTTMSLLNIGRAAFYTIMFYFLASDNDLSSTTVGIILGVVTSFGILASSLGPKIINKFPNKLYLFFTCVTLSSILFFGMYLAQYLWLIISFFIFEYMLWTIKTMIFLYVRQKEVPEEKIGRVNGFITSIIAVAYPISALLLSYIAESIGTKFAFLVTGIFYILAILVYLLVLVYRRFKNRTKQYYGNIKYH